MSTVQSENKTHNAAVSKAEGVRQTAVAAASSQAAVTAAEIAFYRSALASAQANGCSTDSFVFALKSLGG